MFVPMEGTSRRLASSASDRDIDIKAKGALDENIDARQGCTSLLSAMCEKERGKWEGEGEKPGITDAVAVAPIAS